MTLDRIAVSAANPDREEEAKALAIHLGLPYLSSLEEAESFDYLVMIDEQHISLQKTHDKKMLPFFIDFASGKIHHRKEQASLKKEALARAIGANPKQNPKIVDATAGLGRDSFILASLGFQVTMLERSPILWTLLNDAFSRAKHSTSLKPIIERLKLIQANAINWLENIPDDEKPDVIYIDPMFPARQKSASVKKEMQILQELLGKDEDSAELFLAALACAKTRVVVKRPRLAATIIERTPTYSIFGKTSRFDIYLT